MRFKNRTDAGRRLAALLVPYRTEDAIVLGLPRGGVPVAYEVARELGLPLDIWCVRKIGAPGQPELGLGAVAEGGTVYVDRSTVRWVGATDDAVERIIALKKEEVSERANRLRSGGVRPDIRDRTAIVVDDGIATGGTMRAALDAVRAQHPRRLVLAVPVASTRTLEELQLLADDVHCVQPVPELYAVGAWYDDFTQTTDKDVLALLARARDRASTPPASRPEIPRLVNAFEGEISIPTSDVSLAGTLHIPPGARGVVVFAHGSGSSRFSPRNRFVATQLRERGLATLLLDLLSSEEEKIDARTAALRFDIEFLAGRLVSVTDWLQRDERTFSLGLGLFGASTGAAATLIVAARRPEAVRAVVSRGGRVDLAGGYLGNVRAPTLMIVGGNDTEVLELNEQALKEIKAVRHLHVVLGATHLFEEAGALEDVARQASDWFATYLAPTHVSREKNPFETQLRWH